MIAVLAAFATYYLALSITREDGPFGVFLLLRNSYTKDDWFGRGLRCLICMSCWTGLAIAALLVVYGYSDLWTWPVVWLGLAGSSVVIDRYWKR